jgi:hypothetical protein
MPCKDRTTDKTHVSPSAVNEIIEGTFAQLSISKDQGKYVLGEPKFFSSGGVRPAYIEVLTDGSLAIANVRSKPSLCS